MRKAGDVMTQKRTVNVSVQVLPLVEDAYPIVDKAIAAIKASGQRTRSQSFEKSFSIKRHYTLLHVLNNESKCSNGTLKPGTGGWSGPDRPGGRRGPGKDTYFSVWKPCTSTGANTAVIIRLCSMIISMPRPVV